jgi:hypothetical protein
VQLIPRIITTAFIANTSFNQPFNNDNDNDLKSSV